MRNNIINLPLIKLNLRLSLKTLLIWLFVIIFLAGYSLVIFSAFKFLDFESIMGDDYAVFKQFIDMFMTPDDIMNYYLTQVMGNQFIGGFIFASVIAMGSLLREESKGITEFLYAHPLSRNKIAINKLIASQILIFLFNFVYTVITFVMLIITDNFAFNFEIAKFFLISFYVWVAHALIGLVAFGVAGISNNKTYMALSIMLGVIIVFMGNMLSVITIELAKYFSIFEIINHLNITLMIGFGESNSIKFDWICLLVYIVAAVALNVVGLMRYNRKNLNC